MIVSDSIPHLSNIKVLWRANSQTLGFLPEGAFDDHAKKQQILVSVSPEGSTAGYLLYRISYSQVVIVHLCVDETFRGSGIAKELLSHLVKISSNQKAITLKCRRDFSVSGLWPKFGFTAMGEVDGRSKEGHPLTVWRLDFGHLDLFSQDTQRILRENFCVAIDANIFFGLLKEGDPEDDESKALISDWLPDDFEMFVTDEIFNEIERNPNKKERKTNRTYANRFKRLPSNPDELEKIALSLKEIFPKKENASYESDFRQLSRSICGGVKYFITRDQKLLNTNEIISEKYGLSIVRPSDLITRLDELKRGADYEPVRLSGTQFRIRPLKTGEQKALVKIFLGTSEGEKKSEFERILRRILSDPKNSNCFLCLNDKEDPIALFAYQKAPNGIHEIPIFRVQRSGLSPTIIRHLIYKVKLEATRNSFLITLFSDKFISEETKRALSEELFQETSIGFIRFHLSGLASAAEIASQLTQIINPASLESPAKNLAQLILEAKTSEMPARLLECEARIWPAKISDADAPCFIIPIRPFYAQQLFDEESANQDLFGATELVFNRELVYYRSKRPYVLETPARILWYVSKDDNYAYAGQLRACSYLTKISVNKPKQIFGMFKRLGIYNWKDVFKTAKNDLSQEIMAVNFTDTILFSKPLLWNRLKTILGGSGIKNNLQSPIRIPHTVFNELYLEGTRDENTQ